MLREQRSEGDVEVNTEQKIIRDKLGVLKLADILGRVS